jgi:predicted ATPase
MKIALRRDLGGYALDVVAASGIDGLEIQKPFVLLTGPNGSGKSALMRAIRATIGLRGERAGQLSDEFITDLNPENEDDIGRLATYRREARNGSELQKYVPAVLDQKNIRNKPGPSGPGPAKPVAVLGMIA